MGLITYFLPWQKQEQNKSKNTVGHPYIIEWRIVSGGVVVKGPGIWRPIN